jgi:hypothetical protein
MIVPWRRVTEAKSPVTAGTLAREPWGIETAKTSAPFAPHFEQPVVGRPRHYL